MKLTDYAIIFVLITWCVFGNIIFKNDILWENMYGMTMYNQIMDHVVEDALETAVTYNNYMPVIDKERMSENITGYLAKYYMGMKEEYGDYLKQCVKLLIVTEPDGYCIAIMQNDGWLWNEKIFYSQGKVTEPEKKSKEVMDAVKVFSGITLYLPIISGDGQANSIDDYQVLMVYETYPYCHQGKEYKKLIFSGAKVKNDIRITE